MSHGPYLQKVIDCLNNGSIDAPVNSEDAAITTRIIHSLYASYENNSWISINDKKAYELIKSKDRMSGIINSEFIYPALIIGNK